jgi:hypothetical protein
VRSQLPGEHLARQSPLAVARASDRKALARVRPGFSLQAPRPWFAASSAAPGVLGPGSPRGACPGHVRTQEHLHHDEHGVVVHHGRMVAWNSKEARARPAGLFGAPSSIRSARGAYLRAAPTSSLAARTAGSTRWPHRAPRGRHWLTGSNCVRSLPPPGREQQERDATRGWRVSCQRASPPGCGHAAGCGDHSAALALGRSGKSRPSHVGWSETTDQLRTTTAELSAPQWSKMATSDKSFRLDNRGGPNWGSRGREFKSRQPDPVALVRANLHRLGRPQIAEFHENFTRPLPERLRAPGGPDRAPFQVRERYVA